VSFRSDELRNRMREGRVWIDVEDGVGVFAVVHAAGGEDDGDEVDAGVFEERGGAGLCEELWWYMSEMDRLSLSWRRGVVIYLDVNV